MVDLVFLASVGGVAIVALIAWRLIEESRGGSTKVGVPGVRSTPLYVTKAGICRLKEKKRLSPFEYVAVFDHPTGYAPVYKHLEHYKSVVPLDMDQALFGETEPVMIETDLIVEAAYGHEDAAARQLFKQVLSAIKDELVSKDFNNDELRRVIDDITVLAERLGTPPMQFKELEKELDNERDARSRAESGILKERAGTDGRVEQRTRQAVEAVHSAARAGSQERDRS